MKGDRRKQFFIFVILVSLILVIYNLEHIQTVASDGAHNIFTTKTKHQYTIPPDLEQYPESKCYSNPVADQFDSVKLDSVQTLQHIEDMCSGYTDQDFASCPVPNVVHLIPGKSFKFHHYLNIVAIKKIIKPEHIYVHGEIFPFDSQFFMKAVQEFNLELVVSRTFSTIYRNITLFHGEHKADILRMEALLKYGGIYLDMDAYPIKSFKRFMNDEFSIGYQNQEEEYGLNNGIMIGKKCSRFLLRWFRQYKYFNPDHWDEHSVTLPLKLYHKDPSYVKAYGKELLSWWYQDVNKLPMFKPYIPEEWADVYAVHSFYRSLKDTVVDFDTVKTIGNSFGHYARYVLYDGPPM
ncbi:hypothetical protein HK103_006965 [Boothiomyces macroporosus]|uniref:Alpha-1,4-N-acetylglucosaminyltransferase n=1 Tax=Boothiomyces macroporosus TaxID=261099 RepID=A0AAD5UL70_9FUNG|nr:hypothetical protein HK103_006965 [Boothiomyces macroporosus]